MQSLDEPELINIRSGLLLEDVGKLCLADIDQENLLFFKTDVNF